MPLREDYHPDGFRGLWIARIAWIYMITWFHGFAGKVRHFRGRFFPQFLYSLGGYSVGLYNPYLYKPKADRLVRLLEAQGYIIPRLVGS